jgi:hypothetical protein
VWRRDCGTSVIYVLVLRQLCLELRLGFSLLNDKLRVVVGMYKEFSASMFVESNSILFMCISDEYVELVVSYCWKRLRGLGFGPYDSC